LKEDSFDGRQMTVTKTAKPKTYRTTKKIKGGYEKFHFQK